MKKHIVTAIAILCMALLSACTGKPVKGFNYYAITVNGDGDIRSPKNAEQGNDASQESAEGFSTFEPGQFKGYINKLFENVETSKPDKILIFVHGGLNNLKKSTDRVNNLINKYTDGELSYYPILINWDSGFFESYGEHLFANRQGETNKTMAIPTSPLYFTADAGRGIVRAPIDAGYTTFRDLQVIPVIDKKLNKYKINSDLIYCQLKTSPEYFNYSNNVLRGEDLSWGKQSFYKMPVNIITWPTQIITSPIIDGFGTPAWEGMQRRTKVLYNKPEEFDIEREQKKVDLAIKGLPLSVMSEFAKQLFAYQEKHPKTEITLIGHSMGTFIINELIKNYPEINYENIVFMAGADSIRNTFKSILPYLENHKDTKFYNLTLHPQNEVEEPNYFLLPRGSLLVWIDDFFSTPHTQFDRTVGRWENLIQVYGEIPAEIRGRVFIKAFDQESPIKKHGDFGRAEYWKESFWKPIASDAAPAVTIKLFD